MGKYIRKSKIQGNISMMENTRSSSPSGVLTRARTLALQPQYSHSDLSYLQLRSRRLQKLPPPLSPSPKHSTNSPSRGSHPHPTTDVEDSCGENHIVFECIDRSTRESTPCSLIRGTETITTPGSITRSVCSGSANRRAHNAQRAFLTTPEMEEFFAGVELHQQQQFIDKYNYDIMNDLPLPGRYEWVRVDN